MPKNPRKTRPDATGNGATNGSAKHLPQPAAAPKSSISKTPSRAAKPERKRPTPAAPKADETIARSAAAPKPLTPAGRVEISDDEVRLRAYFISEWRMQNGLAGTSDQDWLEARRQLQAEKAGRS